MTASFRALDWLQRRASGEPVERIAEQAGVDVEVIRFATDPYGPFKVRSTSADQRDRWVQLRRAGVAAAEIARQEGVARRTVSVATAGGGPYPNPGTPTSEQVRSWVAARRSGATLVAVATAAGVSPSRVAKATRPFGPFPVARSRALPEGILGRADLARLLGVAFPTIISWEEAKSLPAPDFVTATGRRLWLASAIQTWLPDSGLHRCPDCGAYSRRPALHQSQRHR